MVSVGVLGATGAVGQRFVQLLADHPYFDLTVLTASERSAGKKYRDAVNWRLDLPLPETVGDITVTDTRADCLKNVDIVFSALPADLATKVEADCAKAGIGVCSNASSHRMMPDVPLVVPEVNADHLRMIELQRDAGTDGFIVTNPNCSTIMLTVSLAPIRNFHFTDLRVATMQAISGAGFEGIPGMSIFDNVIPYIGGEEEKMERETLKIMGTFDGSEVVNAPFSVSASCNRVPVIDGHSMAVWLDIKEPVETVAKAFQNWKCPLKDLPTLPEKSVDFMTQQDRPQPRLDRMKGRGMTVSVGRLRPGIRYIAMGHNTIRGAAGASVLNAELICDRGYL
ncbi:aspartate semialdehyde dehydrogenase [Methanospirillum hungatei JF-1]|uniref:aspartate-semialdehyde dehydrogenase n=1 Tax=Methanospirillum hungatei JF-1 (strain ATCC 27890 / DSM 864 / NBRC 100397 / JF-1) TaxID=323259 RepID=Q2FNQ7_METHJ|nr:aspartate-semialdehyde dehydrogenase [Methanospirillum hungatei]ABD41229.1 aspartate semialdehyde dehydrogenase [Methanospirillum hungatei JF-1]